MKKHILSIIKYSTLTLFIFVAIGHLGFLFLDNIVADSGFRIAKAVRPDERFVGKDVIFIIGDSRMMDDINAEYANKHSSDKQALIYNFAFNGIGLPDALSMFTTFRKNCKCTIKRLIINTGALKDKTKEYSEFQLFVSAYNKSLISSVFENKPNMGYSVRLFPLLHFNNEVFLRTLYYYLIGKDDQGHGNNYQLKVPESIVKELKRESKSKVIDTESFNTLIGLAKDYGAELMVITTPHLSVYVKNKKDYNLFLEHMKVLSLKHNYIYRNDSSLYVNNDDYFSDLLHLNTKGQKHYTTFLLKNKVFN